jgi:hypothetical protein
VIWPEACFPATVPKEPHPLEYSELTPYGCNPRFYAAL